MSLAGRVAFAFLVTAVCFVSFTSIAQECRDGATPRIVGGDVAKLRHWPGQAVLRVTSRSSTYYACGGAAIRDRWVLTAAHCFDDFKADGTPPDGTLHVVLGVDDLGNVRDENVYGVEKVVIRDGYIKSAVSRDIALIQLKRPYGGPYARLSLEGATDPQTPPGAQVRVAGFGLVDAKAGLKKFRRRDGKEYHAGSNVLLEAALPTVPLDQCKAQYPRFKVGEEQVCAGLDQDGRDSCKGDSGGPLVAYDSRGCPYQIGVVSWGIGCAEAKNYGVYSKVSHHASWIVGLAGLVKAVAVADLTPAAVAGPTVASTFSDAAMAQLEELLTIAKGRVQIGVKGGNRVKLGKEVVFTIRSDVAGRLIVLDINAAGEVVQLLPNSFTATLQVARVSSGSDLTIPGPGYGFTGFEAQEPPGKGHLIALVVPETFPTESLIDVKTTTRSFGAVNRPVSYLMNLVQHVKMAVAARGATDTQLANWGFGVAEYEITR